MRAETTPDAFRHEAFFYAGEDEFLAGTLQFTRDALAADEPVLVAVREDKIRMLRSELGRDSERVEFVDMAEVGENPARLIPVWREFVDRHAGRGSMVRGIGEPAWPGRTDAELAECRRHESLLNVAFAGAPAWWLLCPYDAEGLGEEILMEAKLTHPQIAEHGTVHDSPAYDPQAAERPFEGALPESPDGAKELRFTGDRVAAVRHFVSAFADHAGLASDRVADLALAVNELATNSTRHADGNGIVRVWRENGTLLCEVEDAGRIEDPLAGRQRPAPDPGDGRGLWFVNQVCDLVQIRSLAGRTAVRLHIRLA